jgi:uncharacterized protein (TIGR03083 family)
MNTIEITDYAQVIAHEGELALRAVERAGYDARVPTCPEWSVADLVRHMGTTHLAVTGFLRGPANADPRAAEGEVPEGELSSWFRQGLKGLLSALREAPADLECFTLFPGSPSGSAFWARRMTHEITVHRVDAELAAGGGLSPVEAGIAADGVDELLTGFHAHEKSPVRSATPKALRVRARDVPGAVWSVAISEAPPRADRDGEGECDCELLGDAGQLFLALWNRPPEGEVRVEGDAAVAELWRTTSVIEAPARG